MPLPFNDLSRKSICISDQRLVANLYAELETIRNIVCHHCKEKISLARLTQHMSTPSQNPIVAAASEISPPTMSTAAPGVTFPLSPDGHDAASPLTNVPITLQGLRPASPTSPTLAHSRVVSDIATPFETTETLSIPSETPAQVVSQPMIEKSPWSVRYNSKIEKILDMTLTHAFRVSTFSVNAVQFSPDGNFFAAGLGSYELGKAKIYSVNTSLMIWWIFICTFR